MKKCINPACTSRAINQSCHGRDDSDPDSCDVCFWRNREANAKAGARYTADLCTQALADIKRLDDICVQLQARLLRGDSDQDLLALLATVWEGKK